VTPGELARLAALTQEQLEAVLTGLTPAERFTVLQELEIWANQPARRWYCLRNECDGLPHAGFHWCLHPVDAPSDVHEPFCKHARTSQRPPEGSWTVWLFSGGRGTGKTRAGAEWVLDLVWNQGYRRIALVGRTPGDVRDVMIGGDSGILNCSPPNERPKYEPSKRRLTWPNGAEAFAYSAATPGSLRGPQFEAAWCDESAAWDDAAKGDTLDTAWNNLMLGLRLGRHPKCLATTTPKRVKLFKTIMDRSSTAMTTGTTWENVDNLAPQFKESVISAYDGTRIAEQELLGIYMEDVDGAMWTQDMIDPNRTLLAA
jgi:phage terminase large subunit-like protein